MTDKDQGPPTLPLPSLWRLIVGAIAILGFGEPTSDGGTGLVPVTLTCGDLCGTTFTYRLSLDAGGTWVITGKAGPVTVS